MQRLEAVFGRDRVEALGGHQLAHHLADLRIVFDDEDVAGSRWACRLSQAIKSRTASTSTQVATPAGATPCDSCHVSTHMTAEPAPLSYAEFQRVDIRVGRIVGVDDFPEARKPAYKLRIDFGGDDRHQEVVSAGDEALLEGGAAEPAGRRGREFSAEADRPVHVGGADARRAGRRRRPSSLLVPERDVPLGGRMF